MIGMRLRCELMIQYILPGVRSLVAKELVYRYKMNQTDAAELIGISQPAISQYLNNVRGESKIFENKAALEAAQALAKDIYERKADEVHITAELCRICKIITESGMIPEMKKEVCPIENFAVFHGFADRKERVTA